MQIQPLPFRVLLKTGLLAGIVVVGPLYTGLVCAEMGYPVRGALKGLSLLVLVALGGWGLWRLIRPSGSPRGGPGQGPDGPKVREPRPPGGRPPALSAAARAEEDKG
jgi:hypothetical protein